MFAHIKNLMVIVGFVMTILSPFARLYLKDYAPEFQVWGSAVILLVGMIIMIVFGKMAFSSEKKKMKELYSRDYKMFLDADSDVFKMIKELFHASKELKLEEKTKIEFAYDVWVGDKNAPADLKGIIYDVLRNNFNRLNKNQINNSQINNNQPTVKCRRIFNKAKSGKCFLQCLFVPLDQENNTLLINRLDENHFSLLSRNVRRFLHSKTKITEYSFISFSPLPDHYMQDFRPEDSYEREVKKPIDPTKYHHLINFQGLILRKTKNEKDENFTYYLMLVYTVEYDKITFSKSNIREIFSCSNQNDIESTKNSLLIKLFDIFNIREDEVLYFEKDHDEILDCITWEGYLDILEKYHADSSLPRIKLAEEKSIYHFSQ